ncbi:MAG: hypothetical protein KAT71_08250 [Gammaproteobacteria bacterium]|nr:hypothetical protein [Gammaproteobacteria bacterium]
MTIAIGSEILASDITEINDRTPTTDEKDALAGTGTPATGNVFVTEDTLYAGLATRPDAIDEQTAGETINGATLPVACYIDNTDDEWYACDGNDTAKLAFRGFATTNAIDAGAITIQFSGIVAGFTGLTKGAPYYVQDDKTIGTSVGTYEMRVGIAVSTTEILIEKNQAEAYIGIEDGNQSITGTSGTHDIDIVCGFRPTLIEVNGRINSGAIGAVHNTYLSTSVNFAPSYWLNGVYQGWTINYNNTTMSDSTSALLGWSRDVVGGTFNMTVVSVTDTGFTFRITNTGDTDDAYWKFQVKVLG